jgi:hypothetical protein
MVRSACSTYAATIAGAQAEAIATGLPCGQLFLFVSSEERGLLLQCRAKNALRAVLAAARGQEANSSASSGAAPGPTAPAGQHSVSSAGFAETAGASAAAAVAAVAGYAQRAGSSAAGSSRCSSCPQYARRRGSCWCTPWQCKRHDCHSSSGSSRRHWCTSCWQRNRNRERSNRHGGSCNSLQCTRHSSGSSCKKSGWCATPGADRGQDPAPLKASSLAGEHEVLHAKQVRLHALRKLARTFCLTYLCHVTMHCLWCPCQSMHTMLRPQYLLSGRL